MHVTHNKYTGLNEIFCSVNNENLSETLFLIGRGCDVHVQRFVLIYGVSFTRMLLSFLGFFVL